MYRSFLSRSVWVPASAALTALVAACGGAGPSAEPVEDAGGGPNGDAASEATSNSAAESGASGNDAAASSAPDGSEAAAADAGDGTDGHAGGGPPPDGGGTGGGGTGGDAGSSVAFPPNCTCLGLGPPACTPTGHITYTLAQAANPTATQQSAYDAITCAMDGAVAYYNCNTTITKQLNVSYNASVATADGNINGSIRFGGTSYMECVTGMHEIAHAVGIGTASNWGTYSVNGVFTGTNAIAQLRAITGNPSDVLYSDTQHFWPYGLNYTSEAKSTADLVDHCLMVTAIRKDLGL
jgi:hypothetical protein